MTSPFRLHVFSCQNERPLGGRPSCAAGGGREVLRALQRLVAADPELCAEVAVTGSACLGPCFDGPVLVVYPGGVWYGAVTPGDVAEIGEAHLRGGRPVERLRYRWPEEAEGDVAAEAGEVAEAAEARDESNAEAGEANGEPGGAEEGSADR